jgi:hypothetical protein
VVLDRVSAALQRDPRARAGDRAGVEQGVAVVADPQPASAKPWVVPALNRGLASSNGRMPCCR